MFVKPSSISFLIIAVIFLSLAPTRLESRGPAKPEESSSASRRIISDILQDQERELAETARYNETGGEHEKELEEDEEAHAVCGLPLYRLPRRIKPTNYNLLVHPDLNGLKFEGSVQISVTIGAGDKRKSSREADDKDDDGGVDRVAKMVGANKIVLHAHKYLKVDDVWYKEIARAKRSSAPVLVRGNNGSMTGNVSGVTNQEVGHLIEVVNVCRDAHYQLIVVTLARDLPDRSRGLLHLSFSGLLGANLRGFYKSRYHKTTTTTTTKNYHAVTQLQAVEARRLFPCFDEPAFKATFDVSIKHQSDKLALSNMAPISKSLVGDHEGKGESDGATTLVKFAQTPPMSTYLLALFVGELDFVEHFMETTKERRQLKLRVYTPTGLARLGEFAMGVVRRALPLLERYFGNDLPLTKLDLIPLGDFESGAMENWGLITFKESSLLVDEEEDSISQKIYVACTIVHELSHQWFGNLVTMKWWNEVWLNEGMATWLEFDLMEELFPEYKLSDYFLIKSHIHGLGSDAYRWSHPIELDEEQVEGPDDIDTLFDAISYNKASSIVRQLSDQFGPENFRRAIQNYINKHKFQNTKSLFASLAVSRQREQPTSGRIDADLDASRATAHFELNCKISTIEPKSTRAANFRPIMTSLEVAFN